MKGFNIKKIRLPKGRVRMRLVLILVVLAAVILGLADYKPAYQKVSSGINSAFDSVGLPGFARVPELSEEEGEYSLGLDLAGGARLVYDIDFSSLPSAEEQDEALESLLYIIEGRVNSLGVREPVVQVEGNAPNARLIIELSGITDPERAIEEIGKTPFLEFRDARRGEEAAEVYNALIRASLPEEEIEGYEDLNPQEVEVLCFNIFRSALQAIEDEKKSPEFQKLSDPGKAEKIESMQRSLGLYIEVDNPCLNQASLTGRFLDKASLSTNDFSGGLSVLLNFNDEGSLIFEELTEKSVGSFIAIVIDGLIISAPTVNEPISRGEAIITGRFALEEGRELVRNLNAGALPLPISLASQQQIGPSLGEESVVGAKKAGIFGAIAVLIFMVAVYRLSGVLAALSLTFYIIVLLAVIKFLPITLTLAGVAGLILSIGMAVDANILVFERLREEIKSSEDKLMSRAIDNAFSRTWPAVRDGNISTLITAFILFYFSSSFVQGFALTLGVGVIISMFSAMVVTRYLLKTFAVGYLAKRKRLWSRFLRI